MPTDIKSETVARALLNRHEGSPSSAASKEKKASAATQKEHWKKRQEQAGSDTVITAWSRGERAPIDVPDAAKTQGIITEHVTDPAKVTVVGNAEKVYRAIMDGDKTALETNTGNTSDALIAPLQKVMEEIPEFKMLADEINASPASLNEWVKFVTEQLDEGRKPGDRRFIDNFKTKYAEFMNRDRSNPTSESEDEVKGKIESYDRKISVKQSSLGKIESQMNNNRATADSYASLEPGSKGLELQDLETQVANGATLHRQNEVNLAQKIAERGEWLERYKAETDASVKQQIENNHLKPLRGEIVDLRGDVDTYNRLVDDRNRMVQEKDGLDGAWETLNDKYATAKVEIDRLAREKQGEEATLKEMQAGTSKPEDFALEFQDIIAEAFKETMVQRYAEERVEVITTFDDLLTKEQNPYAKAALTDLKNSANRWSEWEEKYRFKKNIIPFGKKETKSFDKDLAKEDLDVLIQGGPEAFMRRFLNGKINPDKLTDAERKVFLEQGQDALLKMYHPNALKDPASADAAWHASVMYNNRPGIGEIDKLVGDKEFMDKVSPKAIALLLKQSAQNGLLSKSMQEKLADTDWGAAAMVEAMSLTKEGKKAVEGAEKNMGMKMVDAIKKNKRNLGLAALFLLFPSLGAIIGGVMLTKSVLTSKGGGGGESH